MSYAGCPDSSPAISAQFTLCVAAGNRKQFIKNLYFGSSRSFKVIDVDNKKSLPLLLVMMSVPICNRFHATRDNCGKITTF